MERRNRAMSSVNLKQAFKHEKQGGEFIKMQSNDVKLLYNFDYYVASPPPLLPLTSVPLPIYMR